MKLLTEDILHNVGFLCLPDLGNSYSVFHRIKQKWTEQTDDCVNVYSHYSVNMFKTGTGKITDTL